MSNLTIIVNELSDSEFLTESCPTPPSLAISDHSLVTGTPQHIREWLMSLPEDSPASRLATQESDLAQMTHATCGPQLSNVSASFDHATACWKTSQGWLLADISAPSWETWPKAGLIADGAFYPQPNWERRISEIGCGLLPTPKTLDSKDRSGQDNPIINGRVVRPSGENYSVSLATMANRNLWPTPLSVPDSKASHRGLSGRYRASMEDAMKEDGSLPAGMGGGQLNPDWVEWLMGWPIGWTSLEPLPADNFVQWLDAVTNGAWWPNEPDIPRVAKGITNRVDRLKALGNGQVSAVVAAAWKLLTTADLPLFA